MTLTPEARAALKALADKATPGPWYAHNPDDDMCMNVHAVSTSPIEPDVGTDYRSNDHGSIVALTLYQAPRIVCHEAGRWDTDAEFIAAARTAVPSLLQMLEAAEQERDAAHMDAADALLQDPEYQALQAEYRAMEEQCAAAIARAEQMREAVAEYADVRNWSEDDFGYRSYWIGRTAHGSDIAAAALAAADGRSVDPDACYCCSQSCQPGCRCWKEDSDG